MRKVTRRDIEIALMEIESKPHLNEKYPKLREMIEEGLFKWAENTLSKSSDISLESLNALSTLFIGGITTGPLKNDKWDCLYTPDIPWGNISECITNVCKKLVNITESNHYIMGSPFGKSSPGSGVIVYFVSFSMALLAISLVNNPNIVKAP